MDAERLITLSEDLGDRIVSYDPEIGGRVVGVITDYLAKYGPVYEPRLEDDLIAAYAFDSLDFVEVVMDVEKAFHVELDDSFLDSSRLSEAYTLGEFAGYLYQAVVEERANEF